MAFEDDIARLVKHFASKDIVLKVAFSKTVHFQT
jgi:hypothetical protein